jgi:hypothetical protein
MRSIALRGDTFLKPLGADMDRARQAGMPPVLVLPNVWRGLSARLFVATPTEVWVRDAAGADCIYPFGQRDAAPIADFVKAIDAPVNITGRPAIPTPKRWALGRSTHHTWHRAHLGGHGRDPIACHRFARRRRL